MESVLHCPTAKAWLMDYFLPFPQRSSGQENMERPVGCWMFPQNVVSHPRGNFTFNSCWIPVIFQNWARLWSKQHRIYPFQTGPSESHTQSSYKTNYPVTFKVWNDIFVCKWFFINRWLPKGVLSLTWSVCCAWLPLFHQRSFLPIIWILVHDTGGLHLFLGLFFNDILI